MHQPPVSYLKLASNAKLKGYVQAIKWSTFNEVIWNIIAL